MVRIPSTRRNRKKTYSSKGRRRTFCKSGKKFGRTGFFKVMRWSNQDATNNCAVQLNGNDALPSDVGVATFTLSQMAGAGELVSLFDNYRIVKVLYRWVVTRNPDQVTTAANKGVYPRLVWRHDFNDSAPISRTQMYQSSNIREVFFGDNYQKTKWYSLSPSTLLQMYESATSTAYQPKWKQWMDTADQTAPHYGLKFVYSELYTGVNLRLEAKIVAELKGVS